VDKIDFKLNGELVGEEKLKKIFESSPKIFTVYMMKYLRWSGNTMIGSKKKDGAVRQAMSVLKKRKNGKPWERKFINMLFNYRIDRETLTMRAGLLYTNKKKIHEIGELLESGWNTTSNEFMVLPNYKEIDTDISKYNGRFHRMLNAKELRFFYSKGVVLYFDKESGKLLFTGVKNTGVKSRFNFENAIASVRPGVEKKADAMLKKALERIELDQRFSGLDDEE
jgi:hypothetical protein